MCEVHAIQAGVAWVLQFSMSFDRSLASECMTVHMLSCVKCGSHMQHLAHAFMLHAGSGLDAGAVGAKSECGTSR